MHRDKVLDDLKLAAFVFMVIDHGCKLFSWDLLLPLGRLALPLFVYAHSQVTSGLKSGLILLALGIPCQMVYSDLFMVSHLNILFAFGLGVLATVVVKKLLSGIPTSYMMLCFVALTGIAISSLYVEYGPPIVLAILAGEYTVLMAMCLVIVANWGEYYVWWIILVVPLIIYHRENISLQWGVGRIHFSVLYFAHLWLLLWVVRFVRG